MTKLIQIAHNAVTAKVYYADERAKQEIQSALTYQIEGAEHSEQFKDGHWDGTSSFFDWRAQTFPTGFVSTIHNKLASLGYDIKIIRKPLPAPRGPENPVVDPFGFAEKYDYQPETLNRLLKTGQMIAQVATGGGKSRIANITTARIKRLTLFLTTRGVLMYQMKKAFESGIKHRILAGEADLKGSKVGVLGDGVFEPSRYINVGTVQTLVSRLKLPDPTWSASRQAKHSKIRELTIKFLQRIEFVILEEAHEASGNSYYDIMRHCKNAHYRLALTATPFMKQGAEANMRLLASAGAIGIKISEKMLIDRGILATPYFKYFETQYQPDKAAILKYEGKRDKATGKVAMPFSTRLARTTPWQRAYKLGIVYNAWRNSKIIEEAQRAITLGLPVMILVGHKNHGKLLSEKFTNQGVRSEFIFGDTSQAKREESLKKLGCGATQVLIGSTILDVGVDVPSVGYVILAGGGKAEVSLRQRVGRGLRSKKGANVCMILDFSDNMNNHLRGHSIERKLIIERTPGFSEGMLGRGEDFNFKKMGLKAA